MLSGTLETITPADPMSDTGPWITTSYCPPTLPLLAASPARVVSRSLRFDVPMSVSRSAPWSEANTDDASETDCSLLASMIPWADCETMTTPVAASIAIVAVIVLATTRNGSE